MSRLYILLVIPACLVFSACASTPSDPPASLEAGFHLQPLAIAPDAAPGKTPAVEPDLSSTSSIELSEPQTAAAGSSSQEHEHDDIFDGMDSRHVTFLLGQRMMDDNDWEPVDEQLALGLQVDGTNPNTGHGYEFGVTYSQDSDEVGPTDVDGNTFDLYGGYRHTFPLENHDLHPYLSAGLELIRGEVELDGPGPDQSDDDWSPGAYVRAGIGFDLNEDTRLGIDYRHLFLTDVDIGGIGDADFDQLMLTLGFAF